MLNGSFQGMYEPINVIRKVKEQNYNLGDEIHGQLHLKL